MEQLGHKLLVGDAAEIRRLARRRQKNDRRDADLLLDLLVHDEFPALFRYSKESREVLRQLRYRHKLVKLRTMVVNTLQALAINAGLSLRAQLLTRGGRKQLAGLQFYFWSMPRNANTKSPFARRSALPVGGWYDNF